MWMKEWFEIKVRGVLGKEVEDHKEITIAKDTIEFKIGGMRIRGPAVRQRPEERIGKSLQKGSLK